jgi:hypothetical protein
MEGRRSGEDGGKTYHLPQVVVTIVLAVIEFAHCAALSTCQFQSSINERRGAIIM